ncbi:MAG TPA: hypothetical protein VJJ47_03740 [Candidatus Paceibacterota bacterium]
MKTTLAALVAALAGLASCNSTGLVERHRPGKYEVAANGPRAPERAWCRIHGWEAENPHLRYIHAIGYVKDPEEATVTVHYVPKATAVP